MHLCSVGNVWKSPKWQFQFCSPNHKTPIFTLSRQHEITTFVTDQNIHYTFLPMVHPGPVYWKAAAPKSQDYYNPLLELATVLHAACCSFRVLCTFQGSWRCLRKDACSVGFPLCFSTSFPSFVGMCEMMVKCCVVIPFKGRDCLHCLWK